MAALGCLLPFVLLFAGAILGGLSGSTSDGLWGGVAGLAVGVVGMLVVLWLFSRAREDWRQ